jgi:hypothetical protein
MTTAKWTINTGEQLNLRSPAARVNEKGLQMWGGDARNLITSAFRTRIHEIFYSCSYPHFCPFSTRSDERQQPPPYILGNPSLPFAIGTPYPGTKHGYIYIYLLEPKLGSKHPNIILESLVPTQKLEGTT